MGTSRKRWIFLPLAILSLAGLTLWCAPLVYRSIKVNRARSLVEGISGYYLDGDWQGYEQRLLSAGRLAPDDEVVLQAQSRYMAVRQHPMTIGLWVRLVKLYPRNPANWDGLFFASVQMKDPKMALLAMEGYRRSAPDGGARLREMEVFFLMLAGKKQEGLEKLLPLFSEGVSDERFMLEAAGLMLESQDPYRKAALDWLGVATASDSSGGLAARVIMAKDPDLDGEDARRLAQSIRSHPDSKLEHEVLACSLEVRASVMDGSDGVSVWQGLSEGRSLEDRVKVARWLQKNGDHLSAALMVQPSEAMGHRDAALVHVEVLQAGAAWEEMQAFLNHRNCPLPEVLRHGWLAKCSWVLENKEGFGIEWRRAVQSAKGDPDALGYLANLAEQSGWTSEAEAVCRELILTKGSGMRGWMGLYRLGWKNGDSRLMDEGMAGLSRSGKTRF